MTDYSAPLAYSAASLETAACLWEAVLDMEGFTVGEDYDPNGDDRYQEEQDRAVAIKACREAMGSSHFRLTCLGWVDAIDAAWRAWPDANDGEDFPGPFDWEFVPDWIVWNVDWSDPHNPHLRASARP